MEWGWNKVFKIDMTIKKIHFESRLLFIDLFLVLNFSCHMGLIKT
jgi:hypothetical protein